MNGNFRIATMSDYWPVVSARNVTIAFDTPTGLVREVGCTVGYDDDGSIRYVQTHGKTWGLGPDLLEDVVRALLGGQP